MAHLLHAVGSHQDGHHETLLRRLPHHPLELAAYEQVKHLVRTAEFHVRFDDDRIVGLHQRVQEFRDSDRLVFRKSPGEVIPFQELGHRKRLVSSMTLPA